MSGEIAEKSITKITSLADLRFKENMFGGGVIIDAREVVLLLGRSSENKKKLLLFGPTTQDCPRFRKRF